MTRCIIVDIDGTLADCQHRRHLVENVCNKDKNWKLFQDPSVVIKDALIQPVADMVTALQLTYPIVYVSGREHGCYDVTRDWLRKHKIWFFPHVLIVRRPGDTRPDTVFKIEVLENLRRDGWDPFLAIDDRNSVVQAWRDAGLTCAQVAMGDF